jgi:hypothetical protein
LNGRRCPNRHCVQARKQKTCLNKYGVAHQMRSPDVLKKFKNTSIEKYGTPYHIQSDAVRRKSQETMIDKYGVSYTVESLELRHKMYDTMLKRYGDKYIHQTREKEKFYESKISKLEEEYNIKPLFSLEDYKGKTNIEYNFKCLKCGTEFKQRVDGTTHVPICRICNPV